MAKCIKLVLALVVLCVAGASARKEKIGLHNLKEGVTGEVWALLIAGSSGWGNYRHQADVCHAYQVLKHGGLDDSHIVVMMQDDIAANIENPHQGKIFNKPDGPDVYKGVPKDYTGSAVNAENFLSVLAGQEVPAVLGSSGKVIKSGPEDRVFVYYSDHGAPGILGMPNGEFLYADQLLDVLRKKADKKEFKDMVVYVEACESGSMFEGLLSDDLNIYATTASNAYESSWGTYCPGMFPSAPPEFSTCLGDLYSVAWTENSDDADLTAETLEAQYELVKERTSNGGSYNEGSHVLQFGSLAIDEEPAADYLGLENTGNKGSVSAKAAEKYWAAGPLEQHAVAQREADLMPLWTALHRAETPAAKAAAVEALAAETGRRAAVNRNVRSAVAALLLDPPTRTLLQAKWGETVVGAAEGVEAAGGVEALRGSAAVEGLVSAPLPRPQGAALVDDWDCLRGMMAAWEGACGALDQYGMQYSRTFANLCNAGVSTAALGNAALETCAPQKSSSILPASVTATA